jgi:alcohol dehydrogenase
MTPDADAAEIALSERTIDLVPRPRTVFRTGAAGLAGALVAERSQRVVVVTDRGVLAAGACTSVLDSLRAAGLEVEVFDAVPPNPSLEAVEAGVRAARGLGRPVVVAVGGGASLDVGKAVALGIANDVPARALDYRTPGLAAGMPVLAVPTTAGTGSETNGFGVIADPDTHRKLYLGNDSVQPFAALLDPLLTVGLPPGPTAAGGMDALGHAVESLHSRAGNPYAAALAVEVIATVATWLPRAVEDGTDLEARARLLFAAHVAGLAQGSGTGLGLAHALGHALSSYLGLPHGPAVATVLPGVMRFSAPATPEAARRAAVALGGEDGAAAVEALSGLVGTALRLADHGLTDALADRVVEDALVDPVIRNAPRLPTPADARQILDAAR